MPRLLTFPRGLLAGATLMYFFDPRRGRRRRSRIVNALAHAVRVEGRLFGRARRDATYRAHGIVE